MNILSIPCESNQRCMSQKPIDTNSTCIQVMAKRRHATSLYLNQCSDSSLESFGVSGPKRVKPYIRSSLFWFQTYLTIWLQN